VTEASRNAHRPPREVSLSENGHCGLHFEKWASGVVFYPKPTYRESGIGGPKHQERHKKLLEPELCLLMSQGVGWVEMDEM